MSEFSFDLLHESWIPCIPRGAGPTVYLGITETLLKAHELREIRDASPLVTVSLHRLLLAVLYRALAPLETREQWYELWRAGRFPRDRISSYLERWRDRFDLFSEQHPFYQTPGLETNARSPVSRLANEVASGHNVTLFDHTFDAARRGCTPAEVTRFLVAYQNYAIALGRSGKPKLAGELLEPPDTADGPLIRGMTIWLGGESLANTLTLNLVPRRIPPEDRPAWELQDQEPEALMDQRGTGGSRRRIPPLGVLDLFTWQSRRILLLPEQDGDDTLVRSAHVTQGRSLDKDDRTPHDPMKAYQRSASEGFEPLPVATEKATWRDLHAVLAARGHTKSPEAISFAARLVDRRTLKRKDLYGISVVGLASAQGKAAKILLWRQDRISVPVALLEDEELIGSVWDAISAAERMAARGWTQQETGGQWQPGLQDRVKQVCRLFLAPESDQPDGRQPHPDDVARVAGALNPQRAYWARLERPFDEFLQDLPDNPGQALERWFDAIEVEARRAFREACRALGTSARAIRAVARVSDVFRVPNRSVPAQEPAALVGQTEIKEVKT